MTPVAPRVLCAHNAAGRLPEHTPGPETRSRSPRTWASATRSTRSIADFSERYADQNERDYQAFVDAIRTGRLEAIEGVLNWVPHTGDNGARLRGGRVQAVQDWLSGDTGLGRLGLKWFRAGWDAISGAPPGRSP